MQQVLTGWSRNWERRNQEQDRRAHRLDGMIQKWTQDCVPDIRGGWYRCSKQRCERRPRRPKQKERAGRVSKGGTNRNTIPLTSVDPGSIASLAFNLAPEASCISLIFEPPFPILAALIKILSIENTITYTLPIRELGMMNLIVTAREPGTEATSKGSSLMRRTMRPKA